MNFPQLAMVVSVCPVTEVPAGTLVVVTKQSSTGAYHCFDGCDCDRLGSLPNPDTLMPWYILPERLFFLGEF